MNLMYSISITYSYYNPFHWSLLLITYNELKLRSLRHLSFRLLTTLSTSFRIVQVFHVLTCVCTRFSDFFSQLLTYLPFSFRYFDEHKEGDRGKIRDPNRIWLWIQQHVFPDWPPWHRWAPVPSSRNLRQASLLGLLNIFILWSFIAVVRSVVPRHFWTEDIPRDR